MGRWWPPYGGGWLGRASNRRTTPLIRVGAGGHHIRVPPSRRLQAVCRAVWGGPTRGACRRRTAAAVGRRGPKLPTTAAGRREGTAAVGWRATPAARICVHRIPPTGHAPPRCPRACRATRAPAAVARASRV